MGGPALAFKMRQWRGLGANFQITDAKESHGSLWRDLFFQFDLDKAIELSMKGSGRLTRNVKIKYRRVEQLIIPSGAKDESVRLVSPLTVQWYKQSRLIASTRPEFRAGTLHMPGAAEPLPGAYFSSSNPLDAAETGNGFSSLSRARNDAPLVNTIKGIFPFIKGLSVEALNMATAVYADIADLPEKIPIGLVSSGVNKIVSILVGIASQTHGIILVDEIENGIHFQNMERVWAALYGFCCAYDVQLFVSSHNEELLRKLYPTIKGKEKDFRLIRTETRDGQCKARVFGGTSFSSSLEQGMDVR